MSDRLLGVHLIVRNEEDQLFRCLESIRHIADELIVVDTGSTDGTADIALTFGATVLPAIWEDDFAKARNIALSQSKADWVLIIDADEEVIAGGDRLRECLMQTSANALTVEMVNRVGRQPWECVTFHPVRLLRRGGDREYRFEGRIHEQIVSSDGKFIPEAEIESSPLMLLHDGYMPEKLEKKQKVERNLRILNRILEEKPNDPFHLYNLGVTYCQMRMPEKAAEILALARESTPLQATYRPTLIRDSAKVGIELGRWEETIQLLQTESCRYPDYPDLQHLLGDVLARTGRLQEAYEAYRKAAQYGKIAQKYVTETGIGGFRTHYALARITRKLGSLQQAGEWYEACVADNPLYEPGLHEWADTLQELGIPDKTIMERLRAVTAPVCEDERVLVARLLTNIGAYAEALSLLKTIDAPDPNLNELFRECLMQTGQFREAFERMHVQESDVSEENRTRILDSALCRWSEELDLPYRFYKHLSSDEQRAFEWLDHYVQEGEIKETICCDQTIRCLIPELMERAVKRKLTRIAHKLSRLDSSFSLLLAKLLYRHGFILPAADCLLNLMRDDTLDVEGLYMLGEIVYDKGHYDHAAALFEEVLSRSPGHENARIGASLSYLQMARNLLLESLEKAPHHPAFHTDLQRIDTSIRLLTATGWHTSWNAAERRNEHAAPSDFAVHDR